MASPERWKTQLDKWPDKVESMLQDLAQELAKDLRRNIAIKNPKLTGRSSASWNLALNEPNLAQKPASYNNVPGAVEAGVVNTEGFQLRDRLVISNTVHYVPKLNFGGEGRAPLFFIERSVKEVHGYLPKVISKVQKANRL